MIFPALLDYFLEGFGSSRRTRVWCVVVVVKSSTQLKFRQLDRTGQEATFFGRCQERGCCVGRADPLPLGVYFTHGAN